MIKVSIKWGKEKFDGIDLNTEQIVLDFKKQIYNLTSIPVQKQKIIFKGKVLEDNQELSSYKIPNNANLLLMGNVENEETKIQEPVQKTVFIEDLNPQQIAQLMKEKAGIILPAGLQNLGNTCYLNSSIQCLRKIQELKDFIMNKPIQDSQSFEGKFGLALQKVLKNLDTSGDTVIPYEFINIFMQVFPQFSEREQNGVFKQQDADECFQNMLQTLQPLTFDMDQEGDQFNLIKKLFEIQFEVRIQNQDIPDEQIQVKQETNLKLSCIIDNQSNPINHLIDGIKAGLQEQIEKTSSFDNQSHLYNKLSSISKLPNYLIIQMVRFFWKKGSEVAGTQATKAKILRNVSFPKVLDLYSICSEELKQTLDKGREYEKKQQEELVNKNQDLFEQYKKDQELQGSIIPEDTRELYKQFKKQREIFETQQGDDTLYRQHGFGLETGNYQLIAVLTHKGRTADSGHYVAWVHHQGDDWLKYDDDLVSTVKSDEIMNLRGGGDWHMAYYCIYRKLEVQ